ncbi:MULTISPECIES: purple acid phosphatase family protein [Microbulbifer]|uniref:Fibronectin type III domain-containing protein n=1 Tax=Microbulbifer celer TaxID=435905 RepID=A0ABW3U9D6_9GAMM|nr:MULTISPECIES: metallophosphoesterase family protein [Microbulbifer]UFN58645.1 metallophosphoesterase family protein [Microbulbifer celer]
MRIISTLFLAFTLCCTTGLSAANAAESVHSELEGQVSSIIDRMSRELTPEQRIALTPESTADFFTTAEREYLATAFSHFRVDRPAKLYVAFDATYGETPFWLRDLGFERRKTLDFIVDEADPYHVWSKAVAAGEVKLGVPSLSGEMKPYLVFAAPAEGKKPVEISPLVAGTDVQIAEIGGEPFIDDNDYFNTLPDALSGLPVLRSYESWELVSRFVGYFRETDYPSSSRADHFQLTWQKDPATSTTVQWRTDDSVDQSLLWVAPKDSFVALGSDAVTRKKATFTELHSRQVVNDPVVRLHRVALDGLQPATDYLYAVSTDNGKSWTAPREFHTADATASEPYSFVYLGDPQNGLDRWGQLIRQADFEFPHARFYMIAGDLIDHGQEQDNWDQFFHEGSSVFDRTMLVPALGNHDSHGGHPTLYLKQFALPDNGSENLDPGRTYHVTYQDLLVVVMDSNYHLVEPELQADWLDRVLGESDARWKVVIYHHPFYASREGRDNKSIRDTWGPIFDKHNVDIAFQGHDHAYMRTVPMRGNEPAAEGEQGTVYLVAVSGTKMYEQELPDFAAFGAVNTRTYQVIDVDPKTASLKYRAIDGKGDVIDEFSLSKGLGEQVRR